MQLSARTRLLLSLGVTILVLLAEIVGGAISNSLSLLSDAGHVLTDAFALLLSILALQISRRPSDFRATYGYQRVGLLAAVINGVTLFVIAAFIFIESYERFLNPPQINTTLMLAVATGGLAGNLTIAFILGKEHHDLNIKSAWLHILGDTLSSVGVILSGIIVAFTQWVYADPLMSIMIGVIIMVGGVRVVKEALAIFLEMVPKGVDVEEIAKNLCDMPDVLGVHDLHVWSLAHGRIAFTAHIWVHDQKLSEVEAIREKIEALLTRSGISHIIIQFECAECATSGLYCQTHLEDEHPHGHEH